MSDTLHKEAGDLLEACQATEAWAGTLLGDDGLLTPFGVSLLYALAHRLRDENFEHAHSGEPTKIIAQHDYDVLGMAAKVAHRHMLWRRYPEQHPEAYECEPFKEDDEEGGV